MDGQRVKYFDMMKGVAIFLVVMGHVITMCVRGIDRTPLFKFIENIHMPLFFFISGWFIYKVNDGNLKVPSVGKKFMQLILPMVVVSTLWIFYFPHSGLQSPFNSTFEGLWSDSWKNGYWFTLVLFEIFLIYKAVGRFYNRVNSLGMSALMIIVSWLILILIDNFCPANVSSWLSFDLTVAYFPAFMLGWLGRKYKNNFMRAVHSSWCQTITIIFFALSLYIASWPWEFALSAVGEMAVRAILHLTLAIIAMGVFEKWGNWAFNDGASTFSKHIASFWAYLGTQSLAIYLLHYFFLFPMGDTFRNALESMNVALVPMAVFTAFWALCIIGAVLIVVKIINRSKPFSLLLTGREG